MCSTGTLNLDDQQNLRKQQVTIRGGIECTNLLYEVYENQQTCSTGTPNIKQCKILIKKQVGVRGLT